MPCSAFHDTGLQPSSSPGELHNKPLAPPAPRLAVSVTTVQATLKAAAEERRDEDFLPLPVAVSHLVVIVSVVLTVSVISQLVSTVTDSVTVETESGGGLQVFNPIGGVMYAIYDALRGDRTLPL